MDAAGDFVVVWQSFGQDGSGYGVYARRYNAAGTALSSQEFLVNQTTLGWQVTPDVGMAADGRFVVTWSSQQDTNLNVSTLDYGIYARMFNADGSGTSLGEFRINAVTLGNQLTPAIAVNATDNYVVAWDGPSISNPGMVDIFARVVDPPSGGGTAS